MVRMLFILTLAILNFPFASGQNNGMRKLDSGQKSNQSTSYEITVRLQNYTGKEIYMAQYYADKPYLMDTVRMSENGTFVFSGNEPLNAGMYFIVLPPKNDFLQFVLSETEQKLTISADVKNIPNSIEISGSPDNTLFYKYLRYVEEQQKAIREINDQINAATGSTEALEEKRKRLREEIDEYKMDLHRKNPTTVTSRITYADLEKPIPEYEGDEEAVKMKKFYFKRAHYFDYVDLSSEVLLRSPVMMKKVDFYLEKMTPQSADSIIKALDVILPLAQNGEECFRYLFIQYINEYGQTQTLNFDKIFVHLVNTWINTGKAEFLEPDVKRKLVEKASKMEPILIGKPAPGITVQDQQGNPVDLYEIDAEYMVMVFWKPDCPTCQKAAPYLVKFADKYKPQGVDVFAVCVTQGDESSTCWDYADEKGYSERFLNTIDPYNSSRFYQKYDVRTTPRIMILNKDKEILVNMCGAQQLEEIFEAVRERDQNGE
jgi:thiol-disulfide isomerase/thioredoxin